jgi:hypothetical protein
MEWLFTFKTLIAAAALIAAGLNANSIKWGFLIWACTDFCWMVIDWQHGIPQQALTCATYVVIDLYGFYKFGKRGK